MLLADLLFQTAKSAPDAIALRSGSDSFSYARLAGEVALTASAMLGHGLRRSGRTCALLRLFVRTNDAEAADQANDGERPQHRDARAAHL